MDDPTFAAIPRGLDDDEGGGGGGGGGGTEDVILAVVWGYL